MGNCAGIAAPTFMRVGRARRRWAKAKGSCKVLVRQGERGRDRKTCFGKHRGLFLDTGKIYEGIEDTWDTNMGAALVFMFLLAKNRRRGR